MNAGLSQVSDMDRHYSCNPLDLFSESFAGSLQLEKEPANVFFYREFALQPPCLSMNAVFFGWCPLDEPFLGNRKPSSHTLFSLPRELFEEKTSPRLNGSFSSQYGQRSTVPHTMGDWSPRPGVFGRGMDLCIKIPSVRLYSPRPEVSTRRIWIAIPTTSFSLELL